MAEFCSLWQHARRATAIGSTFNYLDQNRTPGIVQQFSARRAARIRYGIALEVGYIGSVPVSLQPSHRHGNMNINQLRQNYLSLGSALKLRSRIRSSDMAAPAWLARHRAQAQLLLPFPEYSTIGVVTNPATARYDSMVIKVQKRTSAGFTFLSTFTWSKNYDNELRYGRFELLQHVLEQHSSQPAAGLLQPEPGMGLAAADMPMRFTNAWTYALPFGTGKKMLNKSKWMDIAVGGWQINGT